jgi:molybdopterin/thiamine biosynthesis adenylyltransferase
MALTPEERATYEWQMWVEDFGEAGQEKLKSASVMISRVGGLGSVVAYELAAAGVGKLVLAHGGDVQPSDLNRQLLMTHDWIGKPRIESIERRLLELNPRLEIAAHGENVGPANADALVGAADLVIDCAPLFEERFAMNRACVAQGKPMVEAAMFEMQGQLTTIVPGMTPCLACIYPEIPPLWKRQFPVFGAVSATVGALAAMEAIKQIAGLGDLLTGRLLTYDLRSMDFDIRRLRRAANCSVCSSYGA